MRVVHLTLTLAALYAVIVTGMYFAQTWLLFPTVLAGAARVRLPASTQRLEVVTPNPTSGFGETKLFCIRRIGVLVVTMAVASTSARA